MKDLAVLHRTQVRGAAKELATWGIGQGIVKNSKNGLYWWASENLMTSVRHDIIGMIQKV